MSGKGTFLSNSALLKRVELLNLLNMGLLRFCLALAVVAAHTHQRLFPFQMISGFYAVKVFFVISGFYMALILNEKYLLKEAPMPTSAESKDPDAIYKYITSWNKRKKFVMTKEHVVLASKRLLQFEDDLYQN